MLSYILILQVHLPVHLPCYDFSPLFLDDLLVSMMIYVEEGDGRCVRALLPVSIKLSILNLLLNPPSYDSRFHEIVR